MRETIPAEILVMSPRGGEKALLFAFRSKVINKKNQFVRNYSELIGKSLQNAKIDCKLIIPIPLSTFHRRGYDVSHFSASLLNSYILSSRIYFARNRAETYASRVGMRTPLPMIVRTSFVVMSVVIKPYEHKYPLSINRRPRTLLEHYSKSEYPSANWFDSDN